MIYIFEDIESFDTKDLKNAFATISQQRRCKARAYYREIDQKLSVLAYLLLCVGLRKEWKICNPPVMSFGRNFKPYFQSLPKIHFNLSHCKSAVACAISDTPIGIDVEEYCSYDIDVASNVLNEKELFMVMEGDNQREFARYWTMKESYVKYTGLGIDEDFKNLLNRAENVTFGTTFHDKGYACTVCSKSCDDALSEPILLKKCDLL